MAGYHSEYEKSLKDANDDMRIALERFFINTNASVPEEEQTYLMGAINTYAEKVRKAVNAYEAEKLKAQEKASGIFENKEVN